MPVSSFDHAAIPTAQPEIMMAFYKSLGFAVPDYSEWRATGRPVFAIQFGENKINVHAPELWESGSFTLRGRTAQPGCGDFCFVWSGPQEEIMRLLRSAGASIEAGPVDRLGARDEGTAIGSSVYARDPDGNLLEFMVYPAIKPAPG